VMCIIITQHNTVCTLSCVCSFQTVTDKTARFVMCIQMHTDKRNQNVCLKQKISSYLNSSVTACPKYILFFAVSDMLKNKAATACNNKTRII